MMLCVLGLQLDWYDLALQLLDCWDTLLCKVGFLDAPAVSKTNIWRDSYYEYNLFQLSEECSEVVINHITSNY